MAPNLDHATRDFWGSNTFGGGLLYGERISFFRNAGLYEHSRNGYFLRLFHSLSRLFGCRPEEILKARTLEEQEVLYRNFIDPFFDSAVIKVVGRLPVTMFGLGIPPQQYDGLKKDLNGGGSVIDVYRSRVKRLACDHPIRENYFAWQAFARRYDTKERVAVPEYLKAENYESLRHNIGRLATRIGSATDEVKNNPRGSFNRFVLLDAQDWMNAAAMTELWSAIAENGAPGSRVIFRTAGTESPIETNLPADLYSRFIYEKEWSNELFKQDRASIYGGFHLYVLKN
jgi:S-adenosylmethionine-diacylglycerol 3-amino-3-carboxypropyl transferase